MYLEQDEAGEESQVEEELADADLFLEHQSQVLLLLNRHGALGIAERLHARSVMRKCPQATQGVVRYLAEAGEVDLTLEDAGLAHPIVLDELNRHRAVVVRAGVAQTNEKLLFIL